MDAKQMQDAIMQGVARYMDWRQEFLRKFTQAKDMDQVRGVFASLPPEMKELLKQANPEMYGQLTDILRP